MAAIGYARVSADDQSLDLHVDALKEAGCDVIYTDDGASAVTRDRPGFDAAKAEMMTDDVFVVWKMYCAFRSLKNALETLEEFQGRGLSFRCIIESSDTTTAMGVCFSNPTCVRRTGKQPHSRTYTCGHGSRKSSRHTRWPSAQND